MTAGRAMTPRRGSAIAIALTVVVVGLMLLMIMFAARTGPQRIFHGTLRDPSIPPVNPSYQPPKPPAGTGINDHHPPQGGQLAHDLGLGIRYLLYALVAYGAYRLIAMIVARVRDRERPPKRPDNVEFDVLDDPEPILDEMRDGAGEQLDLLLGGEPRNAIVACWDRFEEQAERAGFARKPWQTSSEFTLRLLDVVQADAGAVSRLELLYHEARFSHHEMTESQRQDAVEALGAIHASLGFQAVGR
jgi:hypothetical protein